MAKVYKLKNLPCFCSGTPFSFTLVTVPAVLAFPEASYVWSSNYVYIQHSPHRPLLYKQHNTLHTAFIHFSQLTYHGSPHKYPQNLKTRAKF